MGDDNSSALAPRPSLSPPKHNATTTGSSASALEPLCFQHYPTPAPVSSAPLGHDHRTTGFHGGLPVATARRK